MAIYAKMKCLSGPIVSKTSYEYHEFLNWKLKNLYALIWFEKSDDI